MLARSLHDGDSIETLSCRDQCYVYLCFDTDDRQLNAQSTVGV